MAFKVLTTPSFDREAKAVFKKDKMVADVFEKVIDTLKNDPYNQSKCSDIKKLTDISFGTGQWRLRFGNYRFRYDIDGNNVVFHSLKNRKDCYR